MHILIFICIFFMQILPQLCRAYLTFSSPYVQLYSPETSTDITKSMVSYGGHGLTHIIFINLHTPSNDNLCAFDVSQYDHFISVVRSKVQSKCRIRFRIFSIACGKRHGETKESKETIGYSELV